MSTSTIGIVQRYCKAKGFPVYALFLQDLKKNKTVLPTDFIARGKACGKLWRTTMVGKVRARHYLRASKIVYRRRISLGRKFKGIRPYYARTFATYIAQQTKGKTSPLSMKELAKRFAEQKKKQ